MRGMRLLPNQGTKVDHLVVDHPTHILNVVQGFKVEVKRRRARRFVRGVVPNLQVRVFQSLFDRDPRRGIECQHPVQKIQRVWIGAGEESLVGYFGHVRQVADVVLRTGGSDASQRLFIRRSQVVQDLVELINIVTAFEEGSTSEQFRKDASNRPYVDYVPWSAMLLLLHFQ